MTAPSRTCCAHARVLRGELIEALFDREGILVVETGESGHLDGVAHRLAEVLHGASGEFGCVLLEAVRGVENHGTGGPG